MRSLRNALLLGLCTACGVSTLDNGTGTDEEEVVAAIDPAALTLSGSHFNLNLIGVPKGKSADLSGSNGRRIFVSLAGKTTINLQEGAFAVIDANGTDGTAAFQLPNPDPENDGKTSYSVYARALGKPGGQSTTQTCLKDATGEVYCSIYSMVLVRDSGKSSWSNVSQQLLYVYADLDGDGRIDRSPLFGDSTADYFWSYDNAGLRLAQLRFYEISTTVAAP